MMHTIYSKLSTKLFFLALLSSVLPCIASVVRAEPRAEDHSIFKQLFANKIEDVQKTRDKRDDARLLAEMKDAAESIPDSPEVQRLIYRSMIDLATSSGDFIEAVSAVDRLHDKFPSDPSASPELALFLLDRGYRLSKRDERQKIGEEYVSRLIEKAEQCVQQEAWMKASKEYRRARLIARDINSSFFEIIQIRIDRIDRHVLTKKKIEELQQELKKKPSNTAYAQELTLLLLIDMNSPSEALEFVKLTNNKNLEQLVQLAASDTSSLTSNDALYLADWYYNKGKRSEYDDDIVIRLYRSAVKYSDLMLDQYEQRDAKRLRVSAIRENALKLIEELSQTHGLVDIRPDKWVNIIDKFDSKKHRLGDKLKIDNKTILSSETDFIIPISPKSGYELDISFNFIKGVDGLNFALPVSSDKHFSLTYSRYLHTRIELMEIETVTDKRLMLTPGDQVNLKITVEPVANNQWRIIFAVKNEKVIDWTGNINKLHYGKEFIVPTKFGQSARISCGGDFRFNSIKYRELD